ncbi:MAG: hypothetical protein F6K61_08675 [Sphaerospermopsis sp. SIO1G1]|nr:hypothetical protein [Sphaerospermopsis sp. SIO1G1]
MYYFFTKNYYNNINYHTKEKLIHFSLPLQRVNQVLLTIYSNWLRFLTVFDLFIELVYKNLFVNIENNFIPKIIWQNINRTIKKKSKYLSKKLSINPACPENDMEIKEISNIFVIIDKLLYRHHGKLKMENKYRLVFVLQLFITNLWTCKIQLTEIENGLQVFFQSIFFCRYQAQNLVSSHGESYPQKCILLIPKISKNVNQLGKILLINTDVDDSLNISIKLVPTAFS